MIHRIIHRRILADDRIDSDVMAAALPQPIRPFIVPIPGASNPKSLSIKLLSSGLVRLRQLRFSGRDGILKRLTIN